MWKWTLLRGGLDSIARQPKVKISTRRYSARLLTGHPKCKVLKTAKPPRRRAAEKPFKRLRDDSCHLVDSYLGLSLQFSRPTALVINNRDLTRQELSSKYAVNFEIFFASRVCVLAICDPSLRALTVLSLAIEPGAAFAPASHRQFLQSSRPGDHNQ